MTSEKIKDSNDHDHRIWSQEFATLYELSMSCTHLDERGTTGKFGLNVKNKN